MPSMQELEDLTTEHFTRADDDGNDRIDKKEWGFWAREELESKELLLGLIDATRAGKAEGAAMKSNTKALARAARLKEKIKARDKAARARAKERSENDFLDALPAEEAHQLRQMQAHTRGRKMKAVASRKVRLTELCVL